MATITDIEVAKELPDYKGKGAKVYRYTVEGDERRPEDFVMNDSQPKKVGDSVEIEDSDYGPKVKKAARGGGGGGAFKRDPKETKAIQRQHSQHMALLKEANSVAAGGRPYNAQEMRSVINWFEQDITTKDRALTWDGSSDDVPADMSDTPFEGSDG